MYSRHSDSLIVHHIAGCVKRFLGNSKSYGQQGARYGQIASRRQLLTCSTLLGRQPLRRLEAKTLDAVAQGISRQMQKARCLRHIPLAQREGLQQHVVFEGTWAGGHLLSRAELEDEIALLFMRYVGIDPLPPRTRRTASS